MRPLLFLTGRTILNGLKRAIQSPVRILGVLFIIGWWFFVLSNSFESRRMPPQPVSPSLGADHVGIVYAIVCAGFLLVFLHRAVTMFVLPGRYSPADVDVLFASPVKPGTVLLHRFLIDFGIGLLLPLFPLLISGRRGIQGVRYLFRDLPDPESAALLGQTLLASYLLLAFFCATASVALSLFINRDSDASRTARRVAGVIVASLVAALLVLVYRAVNSSVPASALAEIPQGPAFKILFLPVALAGDLGLSPVIGSVSSGLLAAAVLLFGSAGLLWLGFEQARHLYDMASRNAAAMQSAKRRARQGDHSVALVDAARERKLKPRRFGWLSNMNAKGAWAVVWREAVIGLRTNTMFAFLFGAVLATTTLIFSFSKTRLDQAIVAVQFLLLLSLCLTVAQSGFIDTLRRVDTQKPLPLSKFSICLAEVAGKAMLPTVLAFGTAILTFVLSPFSWEYALAMAIGFPAAGMVVVSVLLIVMLVFPDVEDPAQAGLRGIMQLLGSAIALLPAVAVSLGLMTVV
ncbi:MAG: hypothetical protein H0W86_14335, partial [Armatimonadetes bacterium]|nr:hypothetical protein [Armatimonadota bacterium]